MMFKTDDIRVYQSITVIQMYCRSNYMTEELENGRMGCNRDCKLRDICDCMEIYPNELNVKYEEKNSQ